MLHAECSVKSIGGKQHLTRLDSFFNQVDRVSLHYTKYYTNKIKADDYNKLLWYYPGDVDFSRFWGQSSILRPNMDPIVLQRFIGRGLFGRSNYTLTGGNEGRYSGYGFRNADTVSLSLNIFSATIADSGMYICRFQYTRDCPGCVNLVKNKYSDLPDIDGDGLYEVGHYVTVVPLPTTTAASKTTHISSTLPNAVSSGQALVVVISSVVMLALLTIIYIYMTPVM